MADASSSLGLSLVPSAVASGVGLVRSQLKKREEAYTAEYRASASASGFWRNRLEAGWPLLHFYRMAAPGDTLLSLLLCPEQSEDGRPLGIGWRISTPNGNYKKPPAWSSNRQRAEAQHALRA